MFFNDAKGVWDWGGSNRRGSKAVVTIMIVIMIDPFLGFAFSVLLKCVNELRSCFRESCCKTKTWMHSECNKVQLYCMKTHYNNHKAQEGTKMEQHI
jgi:hypothetical protein